MKQEVKPYKRRKKWGQRKVVSVSGYQRNIKRKEKVYIEIEDEKDET